MLSRKKKPDQQASGASAAGPSTDSVTLRQVTPSEKPLARTLPGPRGAMSPLRVAIERTAHADLVAHAKESLKAEICGVSAGRLCEDDEGLFLHVSAAIRGKQANQGSTHVTFTHATWNAIH